MCDSNCCDFPSDEEVARVAAADAIVLDLTAKAECYNELSAYHVIEQEPYFYDGLQDRMGYIAQAYDLAASRIWAEAYEPSCPPSEYFAN